MIWELEIWGMADGKCFRRFRFLFWEVWSVAVGLVGVFKGRVDLFGFMLWKKVWVYFISIVEMYYFVSICSIFFCIFSVTCRSCRWFFYFRGVRLEYCGIKILVFSGWLMESGKDVFFWFCDRFFFERRWSDVVCFFVLRGVVRGWCCFLVWFFGFWVVGRWVMGF